MKRFARRASPGRRAPAGQGLIGSGASKWPTDERGGALSAVQIILAMAAGEEVGDCSGVTLHDQWDIRITLQQSEEDGTAPTGGSLRRWPYDGAALL
jgi:hypothetical protein